MCRFVKELDKVCCETTKAGRILPFQHLEIGLYPIEGKCSEDFGHDQVIGTESMWKLESMTLGWADDCPVHKPLLTLLRHTSCELKSLNTENIAFLDTSSLCQTGWEPHFPKLEELDLYPHPSDEMMPSVQKEIVNNFLACAP